MNNRADPQEAARIAEMLIATPQFRALLDAGKRQLEERERANEAGAPFTDQDCR